MVLFTTGAVNPTKVGEYVERLISADTNPGEIINHFPEEPEQVSKKEIKDYYDIGTPQFVVAFKDSYLPEKGNDVLKADAEMSILLEILAGRGSRLYNDLYERNLINDSFDAAYEGELTYAFSAFSGESKNPDEVYAAICEEVNRIKKDGIAEDVFERAKRVCFGRAVSLFDKQESFSNAFCRFATKDADFMTYPSFVNKATLSDIETRLSQLDTEKCVLSAIYPKKED